MLNGYDDEVRLLNIANILPLAKTMRHNFALILQLLYRKIRF